MWLPSYCLPRWAAATPKNILNMTCNGRLCRTPQPSSGALLHPGKHPLPILPSVLTPLVKLNHLALVVRHYIMPAPDPCHSHESQLLYVYVSGYTGSMISYSTPFGLVRRRLLSKNRSSTYLPIRCPEPKKKKKWPHCLGYRRPPSEITLASHYGTQENTPESTISALHFEVLQTDYNPTDLQFSDEELVRTSKMLLEMGGKNEPTVSYGTSTMSLPPAVHTKTTAARRMSRTTIRMAIHHPDLVSVPR